MNYLKTINRLLIILSILFGTVKEGVAQNSPIKIIKFNVYAKEAKLFIEWSTDGAVPTNIWEVQSSTNGKDFSTIALILGPDPAKHGDQYQYKEPIKSNRVPARFYRLRHLDSAGKEQISEIIQQSNNINS